MMEDEENDDITSECHRKGLKILRFDLYVYINIIIA